MSNAKKRKYWAAGRAIACVAFITGLLAGKLALAASTTVAPTCTISSAATLDFGNQGALAANVDQVSTIHVTCSNTTPYNIGVDAGAGSGATVATRKMTSGGATVSYSLYSDSAHTTVWGTTVGADAVAATGTGTRQSYTLYGHVPPQVAPAPGTYTDTVMVTVTY